MRARTKTTGYGLTYNEKSVVQYVNYDNINELVEDFESDAENRKVLHKVVAHKWNINLMTHLRTSRIKFLKWAFDGDYDFVVGHNDLGASYVKVKGKK